MPINTAASVIADDAEARKRAVAAEGSVIVRAPAGSGKTVLLVQRFLRLLATAEAPEAVMALTFSRKAATEMRKRLLTALDGAAGPAPEAAHEHRTWELAQAVRRQDAARGWGLLQTPARLQVMTLDALAAGLAARLPWQSRFGAAPRPTEEAQPLYRAAARATLQRIEGDERGSAAARRLLRHLLADVAAAETLLAGLLEHRDQWLERVVGAAGGSRSELRERLESGFAAAVAAELGLIAGELRALGVRGLPESVDLGSWRGLCETALTKAGTQRKAWKQDYLSEEACAALHRVRGLPDARFSPEQWQLAEALFELLPLAVAELRLVFQERGACDFTEITLAATDALGSGDTPTALAFALDARLQHLFVDEFQDTSAAQFRLVKKLVADWSPGDGRTVFLVGDGMQSIYGWRNAKLELFLGAARRGRLGPVALEAISLTANYRSHAALVAWCNLHFADAAAAAALQDCFAPAVGPRPAPEGAAVAIHALPGHNPLTEAVRVAELVEEAFKESAKACVAILAQSRGHLDAILPELRRRRIRYKGVKLQSLAESPVVADLLALTRALRHPADRIAWLAVLRAPWCGLTLGDLRALCGDAPEVAVGDLAAGVDATARRRLTADGRERLERAMGPLAAAARQWGRSPARPLVEWCWRALGGPALVDEARGGDAAAFFELLEKTEQRRPGWDPAELEEAVTRLRATPDPQAEAGVQVMTVHQAKGLEFDTVILPGLGREPQSARAPLLRWTERYDPSGPAAEPEWLFAAKPESGGEDALFDFVGLHEQRRRDEEQLRLLYVAATRARQRLHLLAFQPVDKKGDPGAPLPRSPLARIWPTVAAEFARQYEQEREQPDAMDAAALRVAAAAPAPPAPGPRRVVAAELPAALAEDAPADTASAGAWRAPAAWAGELQRQVGTAVHALLQEMAEQGGEPRWDRERLRAHLRSAGVAPPELGAALARGTQALEATCADDRGRWILGPHKEAHCEWALTGVVAGAVVHRVVDRSFVDDDGTRWIIDYKNAHHAGGDREAFLDQQVALYRPQLALYAELAAGLESTRRVRCGLYFPQLAAWREVAFVVTTDGDLAGSDRDRQ